MPKAGNIDVKALRAQIVLKLEDWLDSLSGAEQKQLLAPFLDGVNPVDVSPAELLRQVGDKTELGDHILNEAVRRIGLNP